jgi:hypothetical protein
MVKIAQHLDFWTIVDPGEIESDGLPGRRDQRIVFQMAGLADEFQTRRAIFRS